MSLPLPEITGYTVTERIGKGGFASVYLATRQLDDERVAIKVLHDHSSNEDDLRRFERERQTMRAFNGHPNIVTVFDSGVTETGSHYMVLEFVGGGSVRDLLGDQRALHWSDATRIAVQVCSALDVAHRSGVLHRDVKPANILLDSDAVKLSDFGIARLVGQSQMTAAQSIIGTLAYTPPEVFHGKTFDGRGDIYQLGITIYEMLLGRPPFSSAVSDNKATIIRRILDKPAPPLEQFDIPAPLSDLLERVLAKDPADRPQTAQRFGELLNAIEVELGQPPTPMASGPSAVAPNAVDTVEVGSFSGVTPTPEPQTPTPPVIAPPLGADATVAGQLPNLETTVMPSDVGVTDAGEQAAAFPAAAEIPSAVINQPVPVVEPAQVSHVESEPSTPAAPPAQKRESTGGSRRWPLLVIALLVVCGVGAGIAYTQLSRDDDTDDSTTDEEQTDDTSTDGETTTDDEPSTNSSAFSPVDTDVFGNLDASAGIVFGSTANSQGLTIVGSVGDGERLTDQRSVVWTLGPEGFEMQREITEGTPHRMWAIGVIDQETFLVVGETPGRDGLAWTGDRAATLAAITDASFTGGAQDYLRTAAHDPSQGEAFLVGGTRTEGTLSVPGMWEVTANPTWGNPEWSLIDLGTDVAGVVNDIDVDGDLAVAVGSQTIDGEDTALMKVRVAGNWQDLIGPLLHAQLWAVTIAGDRIIAVGAQDTNTANPTPVAVIADIAGSIPRSHSLPIRSGDGGVETGIARAVTTLADGTVVAVGDVDRALEPGNADSDIDRDGAVWELLPGDDLGQDLWTTRASSDLLADGFTELWAIDQWNGSTYVFGRTETDDGRQPAGAWVLDLS